MFNWLKSVMTKATIWAKKLFSSGKEPPSRVDEPGISLNDLVESIAQTAKQLATAVKQIAYWGFQLLAKFVPWPQPRFNLAAITSSEVKNTYRWLEGKPLGLVA
ncbi:hypothetical protein [Vibrio paucivorans]